MKQIFYFILLIAGFSSIHSCKDLLDEDGNPLLDLNKTEGLSGPRALYREVTAKDTLAEYQYSGLLVNRVITDSASITDIMYSGERISQIQFRGFLDLDGNGKLDKDSVFYDRQFNYGNNGRLQSISETRSVFRRTAPVPPSTKPGPQTLFATEKYVYTLTYNAGTSKLESVLTEKGEETMGGPIKYTEYSKSDFTYAGDNVSKVLNVSGPITSNYPNVYGTPIEKNSFEYYAYDEQISPFTLLPQTYKISRLLATKYTIKESLILSPNNPKRRSVTDLTVHIPQPIVESTNYVYDPQTYMTKGYNVNYIYKPQ